MAKHVNERWLVLVWYVSSGQLKHVRLVVWVPSVAYFSPAPHVGCAVHGVSRCSLALWYVSAPHALQVPTTVALKCEIFWPASHLVCSTHVALVAFITKSGKLQAVGCKQEADKRGLVRPNADKQHAPVHRRMGQWAHAPPCARMGVATAMGGGTGCGSQPGSRGWAGHAGGGERVVGSARRHNHGLGIWGLNAYHEKCDARARPRGAARGDRRLAAHAQRGQTSANFLARG